VVGAKDFTEQRLIAEITARHLRANGFTVHSGTGFTTTGVRDAQEAGILDVYWEYAGTSLTIFNGVHEKLAPDAAYARVKELDGHKGLVWLAPSKVNNTYALAMRRADADSRGVGTISDLAAKVRAGERFPLATNGEFLTRQDGLAPLQRAYDFAFPSDDVKPMETDAVYNVLRRPTEFQVGVVFSTDGRIPAFDLAVLRDDRGFFPSYILAPVVRRSTLDRDPGLAPLLEALSARLDGATMARLNGMVDLDRRTTEDVAAEFLETSGLAPRP
jgi:osmoprotectant transport system substrate-binding protein